jgi:hypothetical protein
MLKPARPDQNHSSKIGEDLVKVKQIPAAVQDRRMTVRCGCPEYQIMAGTGKTAAIRWS